MSKRNTRGAKAKRRAARARVAHVDLGGQSDRLCRAGCGRLWDLEIEAEDGYCAYLCEVCAAELDLDLEETDPVHGRIVAVRWMDADLPAEVFGSWLKDAP